MYIYRESKYDDNQESYKNEALKLNPPRIKEDYRDIIATINGVDFVIDEKPTLKKSGEWSYTSKEFDNNISQSIIAERVKNEELNYRPIVGILAQEMSHSLEPWFPNSTSYIGAAYVKYIEQAGARVVPVLINQPEEYYEIIFNSTNGLLIPGGAVSLDDSGI